MSNVRAWNMIVMSVHSTHTEDIMEFLGSRHGNVMRKVWRLGDRVLACSVHDEYVLRTNSHQTLTTIVEADWDCCGITIVGSGGGSGLLKVSWGSESAGERTIQREIKGMTSMRETAPRACGLEL